MTLQDKELESLNRVLVRIDARKRAALDHVKYFIEPSPGLLARAKSDQHQFIFGRRGSGKTSVIYKCVHDLSKEGHPVTFVDVEPHSPLPKNALIAATMIDVLSGLIAWLDGAINAGLGRQNWLSILVRWGGGGGAVDSLARGLAVEVRELCRLTGAEVSPEAVPFLAPAGDENPYRHVIQAPADEDALGQYLLRRQAQFSQLIRGIGQHAQKKVYVFIDDAYRIRLDDQPHFFDYFNLRMKNEAALKFGTVRHRSRLALTGADGHRVGVNIGNDYGEVDLDQSLATFDGTSAALMKILEQIVTEAGLKRERVIGGDAADRIVRGSGGVARDFLLILHAALKARIDAVSADIPFKPLKANDIYAAIEQYSDSRQKEFTQELTTEDRSRLGVLRAALVNHCLDQKTNVFCVPLEEDGSLHQGIATLMDLKVIHLVKSKARTSTGVDASAFMLDMSLTAPERKRRKITLPDLDKKVVNAIFDTPSLLFTEFPSTAS